MTESGGGDAGGAVSAWRKLGPALGAVACLALWVVLAFVMAVPSGWVHVPLALATVLIAVAIVRGDE
jgi:hypothetical protein